MLCHAGHSQEVVDGVSGNCDGAGEGTHHRHHQTQHDGQFAGAGLGGGIERAHHMNIEKKRCYSNWQSKIWIQISQNNVSAIIHFSDTRNFDKKSSPVRWNGPF